MIIRLAILITVWFALMFASLQIRHLDFGHAICGEWGCGPPTSALLSMHAFWLSAILPPVLFAVRIWPFLWRRIGWNLVLVSVLGLFAIGIWDFVQHREIYQSGYAWQRYLFRLATLVDVPVLQLLITGLFVRIPGIEHCCSGRDKKGDERSLPAY